MFYVVTYAFMSTDLLNTAEVAERLGLTVRAIQKMIEAGRLPAHKVGRDYVIVAEALENIPKQAPGRPPKTRTGKTTPRLGPTGVRTSKEALLKSEAKKKGGKR